MPSLISLQGLTTALDNLALSPGTQKEKLLSTLRDYFPAQESLDHTTAIPAEALIASLWEVDDPDQIKQRKKSLSSLKSSLNKALKELTKAGKNDEGIIIGRDNTFIISDEHKNQLLKNMRVAPDSKSDLQEMLASFKKAFPDLAQGKGLDDLNRLFTQLETSQQTIATLQAQLLEDESRLQKLKSQLQQTEQELAATKLEAAGIGEPSATTIPDDPNTIGESPADELTEEILADELIEIEEDETAGPGEGGVPGDEEIIEEIPADELIEIMEDEAAGPGEGGVPGDEEIIEEIPADELIEIMEDEAAGPGEGELPGDEEIIEEIPADELIEIMEDEAAGPGEGELPADEEIIEEIPADELIEIMEDEAAGPGEGGVPGNEEIIEEIPADELIEIMEDEAAGPGEGGVPGDEEIIEEIPADELIEIVEDEAAGPGEGELPGDELIEIVEDEAAGPGEGELPGDEEIIEEIPADELTDIEEIEEIPEEELTDIEEIEEIPEEELTDIEEIEEIPEEELTDIKEIEEIPADELTDIEEIEEIPADELTDIEEIEEIPEEELTDIEEIEEIPADELTDIEEIEEIPEEELTNIEEIEEIPADELIEIEEENAAKEPARLLEILSKYIDPEEALSGSQETLYESEEGYVAQLLERFTPKFIKIPAGEYQVGSRTPKADERPRQLVSLASFYLGQFPVTNDLFELFVRDTGYQTAAEKAGYGLVHQGRCTNRTDPQTGRATFIISRGSESRRIAGASWRHPAGPGSSLENMTNHPVVQVSHQDALAFATWAGKRLPTEDEWEAAARGPNGQLFPWGNAWISRASNFADHHTGGTTPVNKFGRRTASPFGIHDLLGNVYEWTASLHPTANNLIYILKGGCWTSTGMIAVSHRHLEKETWSNTIGFRCAV